MRLIKQVVEVDPKDIMWIVVVNEYGKRARVVKRSMDAYDLPTHIYHYIQESETITYNFQ